MALKVVFLIFLHLLLFLNSSHAEIKYTRENMPGAQYYDGKKLNITISKEAGLEVYERWTFQGLSSLISSIADKKSKKMNEYYRNKLFKCSKSSQTVFDQSECVFRVIDEHEQQAKKPKQKGKRLKFLNSFMHRAEKYSPPENLYHPTQEMVNQAIEYRTKREVIRRQNYELNTEMENMTPFGIVGKYLSQFVHRMKNKKKIPLPTVLAELKKKQEKIQKAKKLREQMKKKFLFAEHGASHLLKKTKLSKVERQMADELGMPDDLVDAMKMQDDLQSKQVKESMHMLRQSVKLAAKIAKDNTTGDFSDKKMRIVSPRFLSVVPDDDDKQISLLSPSLFSLHNEGKGLESLLSIPNLINSANSTDYKEWLNFIIEASGVTDAMDSIKEEPETGPFGIDYKNAPRGIDGQPMYLTKENLTEIGGPSEVKKAEIMEQLQTMLVPDQNQQFKEDGYSVLTPKQLDLLYGPGSPYANANALRVFKNMTKSQTLALLETNLRSLGKAQTEEHRRRKRAIILSPVAFAAIVNAPEETSQPFILSPVIFTLALFSPAVFGPVIVTPWLFVSVILSPRLMCPVILSPVALSAVVLSPLAFDPLILSPAALVAFVLSPLALSPNILSPNVLIPVILSPLVLSPNVFNPTALNAIVLSPFVLNPSVFSPTYVSTLVLSPHALSPLINSTGKAVSLILSPSALS